MTGTTVPDGPALPDPRAVAAALAGPGGVAARRRVVAQLLSSLLYEGVLAADPPLAPAPGRHVVTGRGATYAFTAWRAHGFARVRLGDDPVVRTAPGASRAEVTSLPLLVDELLGETADLRRFAGELVATQVNDALAEQVRRARVDVLADAAHDALEGLVTDGHRYHPTYKSRVGFDVDDDVAFGPEFRPALRPLWLAVDPTLAETVTSGTLVPDLPDATGWVPVPVHPWQWRERLVDAFAEELADGRLAVLGPDRDAFVPQQSIRTLACRDQPARAVLKLALSIVNTSTVRTLAPHTVRNAAPVSDWLRGLVADDPELGGRVVVLGETRGTTVRASGPGDAGVLGAIWREPLGPFLRPGERAVPATALTARERDGTPVVAPWIAAHGAQTWVRAWAAAVAAPLVAVLARHGVALESHTQNVSVVLDAASGLPVRVAVRDFHDGVRFSRALLAEPDRAPVLEAPPAHHANRNSFLETDDPAQVGDFLLDAFFFVHAGELGLFLHEHGLLDERRFWALVADALPLGATGPFDLTAPTLQVERLTTRRLGPDVELALHTVPNPLHDPLHDPPRSRP